MTATTPSPHPFPDADTCEAFNRGATLYYKETPEETPCIEVAGVQCYLYLDAKTRRVVVSVHVDGADEAIISPESTAPIEVLVGGETVFIAD